MATLTISLASTPLTGSKAYTLSDADASKFIEWAQAQYTTTNDQGQPVVPTPAQALVAWANGLVQGTINNVQSANQTAAAAAAMSAVTPISIS